MRRIALVIVAVLLSAASAQMTWTCATESAPWGPRSSHASIVFDNKLWILGGALVCGPPEVYTNDVWCSANGADWTCVAESAPWSRRCPGAVVFDNKIWVIGGWKNSTGGGLDDVWYSIDGESWTLATAHAGWAARGGHGLAAFDGKIWLVAGWVGGGMRDVRWSTDGVTRTLARYPAPWPGRYYPGFVVFDNKLWVMGGQGEMNDTCLNDVWWSTDGDSWTKATDSAGWCPRAAPGAAVFGDKMWVMGGMPYPPWKLRVNDVWYSTDGDSWTCLVDSAPWRPRGWRSSLVYDNKIWVMGGDSTENSLTMGDVWYSSGLGVEESRQPQASSSRLGPTILSRASGFRRLASCEVFDAMGRRAVNPKPGVYFVRSTFDNRYSTLVTKVVVAR